MWNPGEIVQLPPGISGDQVLTGGEMTLTHNSLTDMLTEKNTVTPTELKKPAVGVHDFDRSDRDKIFSEARETVIALRRNGDTRDPQQAFDDEVDYLVGLFNARLEAKQADEAHRKLTGRKDAQEIADENMAAARQKMFEHHQEHLKSMHEKDLVKLKMEAAASAQNSLIGRATSGLANALTGKKNDTSPV